MNDLERRLAALRRQADDIYGDINEGVLMSSSDDRPWLRSTAVPSTDPALYAVSDILDAIDKAVSTAKHIRKSERS